MKTLSNHTILYDAECPMCKMYTSAFTHIGMLDKTGAQPYQQMSAKFCPFVDQKRAVNEIALVNNSTGEVTYGIQSLFKVLGNAMPVFIPLFAFQPFIWLMTKLYAFISYNRKVVIPSAVNEQSQGLQPDFKLTYRLVYLLFTWLVASFILTRYAVLLEGMVPVGGVWREYFICAGQMLFQALVLLLLDRKQIWTYLGNMMTVSFAGALLLLPVIALGTIIHIPALYCTGYFLIVAGLMFLEHFRRMTLLQLGYWPTLTWLLYRLLLLFVILFLSII